jgi:predicted ATPase
MYATTLKRAIGLIIGIAADIHRRAGNPDTALETIDSAFAVATPLGQLLWDAELHRLRGEIRADEKNDPEAAEASFREALETARSQEAKSLELRAATSYGRLLRDQGRGKEAHALLAPVYDWFTEGHDLPDLVAAKALLRELGG